MLWQRVISTIFILCGDVAACYMYGVFTVWWFGSVLWVWFVYCVVVLQRVLGIVCVLYGGVAACNMHDVFTVWWCGSVL